MGARPKVVLDTNVIISALGWKGPEHQVFRLCLQGDLELYICPSTLDELLRVMEYPKFKFPQAHKAAVIQDLMRIATMAEPSSVPDIIKEDPADNQILACASAARADFIFTGDRHLLKICSHQSATICTAADFLTLHF